MGNVICGRVVDASGEYFQNNGNVHRWIQKYTTPTSCTNVNNAGHRPPAKYNSQEAKNKCAAWLRRNKEKIGICVPPPGSCYGCLELNNVSFPEAPCDDVSTIGSSFCKPYTNEGVDGIKEIQPESNNLEAAGEESDVAYSEYDVPCNRINRIKIPHDMTTSQSIAENIHFSSILAVPTTLSTTSIERTTSLGNAEPKFEFYVTVSGNDDRNVLEELKMNWHWDKRIRKIENIGKCKLHIDDEQEQYKGIAVARVTITSSTSQRLYRALSLIEETCPMIVYNAIFYERLPGFSLMWPSENGPIIVRRYKQPCYRRRLCQTLLNPANPAKTGPSGHRTSSLDRGPRV